MNSLRLRIFANMLSIGLVPLTIMVIGLRFLPGGLLPWLLYGALCSAVIVAAIARCGSISRPLKESLEAMGMLMRSTGTFKPKAWVPKEYWAMQDSMARVLAEEREQRAALEKQLALQAKAVSEAETAAMRGIEVLRGIVEVTAEAVVFVHAEGHVTLINPKAVELFALTDELAGPGVACKQWFGEVSSKFKDADQVLSICKAWQDAPGAQEDEWTNLKDRTISVRSFDIREDHGLPLGRLWMFLDVTEQRQMAKRLLESQKMESIGQLAGGIAHDFNNLLTAIRGNLTLAELQDSTAELHVKIGDANRAAGRAAELVNQILGFSRKNRAPRRSTNVAQIFEEVRNILRASLDPKVTLRYASPKDLWLACGDPVQVEQVILNLCLNARDALPESGGSIELTTSNVSRSSATADDITRTGDFVAIKVKDNGHGISAEARDKVFEPFFTTKEQGRGTGLGLSTAKKIIEQAGGWMEFDSEEGKGTEFRVFLPRNEQQVPVSTEAADPREARSTRGSGEGTVLVVDDEAPVRSIAVNMLKYLGYTVIEAEDGEQAVSILKDHETPIDAMMMDVYMPKLSGRDTFKQIRALGIDVPVIVCSGFMVEADEFQALSHGPHSPVEVIQKPYSMEALARVVSNAVAQGHQALSA